MTRLLFTMGYLIIKHFVFNKGGERSQMLVEYFLETMMAEGV